MLRCQLWLFAPAILCAQALTPPSQDYVLHFLQVPGSPAVATTDQINLGATFTMESWVFLDAASPFSVVMGKPNNPRSADPFLNYSLGFEDGGRKASFIQTTGQPGTYRRITGTQDLPLYTWTHLAAVLDAGVMRLYVNGQQVASGQSPGPPAGNLVPFGLGGGLPDGKSFCCSFLGAMREARLWSRALSASELRTYATQKLTGSEPGLIADWPASDGSGQVVRGIVPQAPALTILGSASWAHTQLLDNGPYWEIQELPSLTNGTYGAQPALFLNADRRPDILVAYTPYAIDKPYVSDDTISGPVLFLHNEGKRVFSPVKPAQPAGMVWPRNSTVADFDRDGLEDVVMADHGYDAQPFPGGITRFFMQRTGGMQDETASRSPSARAFTHDVCSGDVNRDGNPDLFFGNGALYVNDGTGHFKSSNELLPSGFKERLSSGILACLMVDLNRDGAAELLIGTNNGQNVRNVLLWNDGKGNLRDVSAQALPPMRGGPTWATHGFAVADVNHDGLADIIVTLAESGATPADGIYHTTLQLLINNGDGTFHDQEDAALNVIRPDGWYDKAFAIDFNQDGWTDLLANEMRFGVRLYQNMGGRFEDRTEILSSPSSKGLPADFDGDGRIDIALFNETHTKIAWGKNQLPPVATSTPVVTSVNMAGGFPAIAQNGWIEIKGINLTPLNVGVTGMTWDSAREFETGRMPAYLAGISVTVNGKPAFVYYVSPAQLNVLSPVDNTIGAVQIVVTSGGRSSLPFNVDMRATAPSFPLFRSKYIVATHADYTLVGPASLSAPGYPVTPARPGETIVLYGFGYGLPTTALTNGASTQSGRLPASPVIQIGGAPATVTFAGVISPGLYQFNVIVPSTASDGDASVSASYAGAASPTDGVVAVKR